MTKYGDYKDKAEPEEDGQEVFVDSSDEDEDEAEDNYEQDDFIVDDAEEEEGEEDVDGPPRNVKQADDEDISRIKRKKKKKKKRHYYDDEDLADDDIHLMEENGFRVERRKNKRLKRLKKGAPDDDRDEVDEEIRNLNQDYDEEHLEERRRRADEPVDFEEDDLNDFIEDRRENRRRRPGASYASSEAVRTARSIFGDIDEISQYQGNSRPVGTADGDDEEDEDYRPDSRGPQSRGTAAEDITTDRAGSRRYEPTSESGAIANGLAGPTDDKQRTEKIVETDIPERLQYHFRPGYRTPSESQIRDEANWIYRRGFLENPKFRGNSVYESDEKVIEKIVVLLSYIHIDKLDIPFIAMYRQDYVSKLLITPCGELNRNIEPQSDIPPMPPPRGFNSFMFDDYLPGLSIEHLRGVHRGYDDGLGDWSILWLVLDLDKKYANLTRRRNMLLDAIEDARVKGVPASVLDDVRTLAHNCDDEKDLRDGERHLRLSIELANSLNSAPVQLEDSDEEQNNRRSKRPSRRKNRYTEFCKRGYRALTKDLGINARQFGENLKGVCDYGPGSQVHVPVDSDTLPYDSAKVWAIRSGEVAGELLQVNDKSAERMLSFARFILVTEIISDLAVLQATQRILCRPGAAVVSTTPTEQGMEQVDDTHPLRCITSLSEKKIEDFRGTADFALIGRAVELGFTKLEINFRQDNLNTFRKHLESSIVVESSSSPVVEEWNKQRRMVTDDVHKVLVKVMIRKVCDDLEEETSQVLRFKLMNAASRRFLMGPARISSTNGSPRVLAFSVTSEDDEEPDPVQSAKEAEDLKKESASARRVAPERITMVELDENGEYAAGHELFAAWLRRPMRIDGAINPLPAAVRSELLQIILKSRAQVYVIGVGSGQRTPIRLFEDIVDLLKAIVKDGKIEYPIILKENIAMKKLLLDLAEEGLRDEDRQQILHLLTKYIIFVDDSPCQIYAKSVWASKGLSVDNMTLLEKRTIGLGRMAQEPLWVYSAIGHDKELASRLQFHTYHYYANHSDRLIALNRALVRGVCVVGVDINRSLRFPHTQSMLAYVGGLGVHKANALMKELGNVLSEEERSLKFRKDLWSQKYIGRIVFLCAAAFIRVRDPELHPGGDTRRATDFRRSRLNRRSRNNRRRDDDESPLFDPRDDSRIHPEHYMVAGKIADEALRDDGGRLSDSVPDTEEFSEELRLTAAVLNEPEGLNRLDLNQYAAHLANLGRGSLFETVRMIADEFKAPFFDYRIPLRSPTSGALFYIVTGSDPMLMRIGSSLTATNCVLRSKRNQNDGNKYAGISCQLPMNIRGFIRMGEFSDERLQDHDIQKLVPDGCSLSVRILDFNFAKFDADLTSKVSVVENPNEVPNYISVVDTSHPAFRPYVKKHEPGSAILGPGGLAGQDGGNGRLSEADIQKNHRSLQIRKTLDHLRNTNKALIQHSLFLNVNGDQATVNLRSALPGDILIRPSQYSVNDIVFSCKFASLPGLNNESRTLLHIPCRVIQGESTGDDEDDGCRYKINGISFEHVDQALDEHIRPILSNLSEAIDHRKFITGTIDEISKKVLSEKAKDEKAIPYYFGLSETFPAGLVLVFIPGTKTVIQEEIIVVPNGYRFRGLLHIHLNKLISWFKLNMRKGIGTGPDGRGERRARPSTVGSVTSHAGPGAFGASATTPNPMMPSVLGRPRSVRDTAPGLGFGNGGDTGGSGAGGGRPPTAPYQSPYHAPPQSPFVARGEPAAPSPSPMSSVRMGGPGPGGGVSSASGMGNMMAAMSGGSMGMGMNSGMGMGNSTPAGPTSAPAPVRDSAPPPAPAPMGYSGGGGRGRGYGSTPMSVQHQQMSYNGNNDNGNIDWSRARPRNEPPPSMSNGAGTGRGAMGMPGGAGMDFNRPPSIGAFKGGGGGGGPGSTDFNRPPPGGGRGRGGDGNDFNPGGGPGPNPGPGGGRGGGGRGGGEMPAWRGQAPVPAWKNKQQQQGQ